MTHRNTRALMHLSLTLLCLGISADLQAQQAPTPSASDWGGIGLLQTPTARMADEGERGIPASHTSPYSRYTVTLQPLPWLEGSFRYISIANRRYGPASLSGSQNYKDKSIDLKLRLLQESRWRPELALGARDIGGTGLFSSEYLVANKRFGPFDASLGLATGYIGNRGDFSNPLRHIDDRFENRPNNTTHTGELNTAGMFRGPVGVFAGVAYQTPWESLQIKLEYEGNDYRNEPQRNQQRQRHPFNLGAAYAFNDNVQFQLGWERGDKPVFGLTLHGNLATARSSAKPLDPPPAIDNAASSGPAGELAAKANLPSTDWAAISSQLEDNAGLRVTRIARRGPDLVVSGEQRRFLDPAIGFGRASRILDHAAAGDIRWLTIQNNRLGIALIETSVERAAFRAFSDHRVAAAALRVGLEPPSPASRHILYEAPLRHFEGAFNLDYQQTLGGPDNFILFQLAGSYSAELRFTHSLWMSGTLNYNLYNNYDRFRYDAPSKLPRVRTDIRQYLTTAEATLPNLQLTATGRLGPDLYAMAYAGMLESMYGGVGGEVLYRPFLGRWAFGADINLVKQRDFDQRLHFRDYSVATGHASLYYTWGDSRKIVATLNAGRYLAKDWGATLTLNRVFDNGASMGAYATKTNVSASDFGEGSFDKGILVSVPFDLMLPRSSRTRANLAWSPLSRDGGARLSRRYMLYPMTNEHGIDAVFAHPEAMRD